MVIEVESKLCNIHLNFNQKISGCWLVYPGKYQSLIFNRVVGQFTPAGAESNFLVKPLF